MTTNATKRVPALLEKRPDVEPQDDGKTHINISMTGATELGQKLAHFARTPFIHPFYGPFKSMEGFWHYIKSEEPDDNYRTLVGARAKAYAKTRKMVWRDGFTEIIIEANYHKAIQNADIRQLMSESTLPFQYYYLTPAQVQVFPETAPWLCAGLERVRQCVKRGESYPIQPIVSLFVKPV
ncbi:hypothetical protein [Paraburkholderia sp. BCC1886]|uniref:hypothetical protein n=1 Tax=Paraburkholderia sp. BCC1886 TaxID=2562670 RepID=UPI0011837882|nr:hypothetical protein [Paraburkholderia sp. BCC1886]